MYDTHDDKRTTKECITKAFLHMYETKPLGQINVSDLAKACNISRSTFYFYFDDIFSLYNECERDLISGMEAGLLEVILCTVGMDFEKFIEIYGDHLKGYIKNVYIYKCLLSGSEESSFRKAWFDSIRRYSAKSMNFSHDEFSSQRDNLTLFFAGGQLAMLSNWVLSGCKEPVEHIANITAQALFHGAFLVSAK